MRIRFEIKFAEKSLDVFINLIHDNWKKNPEDSYVFDCTNVERISNEELLVFTALLWYFVRRNIDFRIEFIKPGVSLNEVPDRVAKQIIQIWEVWKIRRVLQEGDFFKYFGLDKSAVDFLKGRFAYNPSNSEIYSRYGITPFVILQKIDKYDDRAIENILNEVYLLNKVVEELLHRYKCDHPFVNQTLSHIISKELYENFLDHFESGLFGGADNAAFMSLSLHAKLNEKNYTYKAIQEILKANFLSEALPETYSFFFDHKKNEFKNQSLIQFSFVDFGNGITHSLYETYKSDHQEINMFDIRDADILKYAFRHDTSRYGWSDRLNDSNDFIPRGLFDVLSIVHRYQGLIVVRSNRGKILYNFSDGKNFDQAFSPFGSDDNIFPGTIISIYIPAEKAAAGFDTSVIKPMIYESKYKLTDKKYINLYQIINGIQSEKKDLYRNLFEEIKRQMPDDNQFRTIFFSFRGYEHDPRLARKAIYFLLSDYDINIKNNVIVVHPPAPEIVDEISNEVASLHLVVKNYHIHPLPLVYYERQPQNIRLKWLGVYNKEDRLKLDNLMFEQFSLSKTDFLEPENVIGHINYFDTHGNLKTFFPGRDELLKYYSHGYQAADEAEMKKMIDRNNCLFLQKEGRLFLCHGNYYQYEFFEIVKVFNVEKDCNLIAKMLFLRIRERLNLGLRYSFIAITSSSHKLLSAMVNQRYLDEDDAIYLDNYFSFNSDDKFARIREGGRYILICDIIATGYLAVRLQEKIGQKKAELTLIAVVVSTIHTEFENSRQFIQHFRDKLIALHHYPIPKFRVEHPTVKAHLLTYDPVRVNPFTNVSINLSIQAANPESVLLTSEEFLDEIQEDDIKLGYLRFNNMVHPYFFDTRKIISAVDSHLLKKMFAKIPMSFDRLNVFYPKDSGIKCVDFNLLNNEIFKNHSVAYYELERFNTSGGWRFPHSTDFFIKLNDERTVLILDDGSCTGDSLIQMIDEIAFSNVTEIVVLCLIGRVTDHKKEFFSRLTQIRVKDNRLAKVSVYFGTHWHIPTYYLDENPHTKERAWLEKVIFLQNTPEPIRQIATIVLDAITPRIFNDFRDYKYIPHKRDIQKEIPKKDIIRVRQEIGKIIEYRFYVENFHFFNHLIRTYESGVVHKDMELLCAAFVYEPYLFPKIKKALPDITEKMEAFVDHVIFANPDNESNLFYKWDKKDIVHLFFIVYKGDFLVAKLKHTENLIKLIHYLGETEGSINYIFYKTLAYFPLNKNDFRSENTGLFLHLTDLLLQNNALSAKFLTAMKIFRSFVSTLPGSNGYYAGLSAISELYRQMKDSNKHKDAVLAHYDRLSVDLLVFEINYQAVRRQDFIESWEKVSKFMESILSFSRSYPSFFLNKLSVIEGESDFSLGSIHGQLNELMNNISETSDFSRMQSLMSVFKDKFLDQNAEIAKIFREISTPNSVERIIEFFTQESNVASRLEIETIVRDTPTVDIPYSILDEIVFKEVITNLRHSDPRKPICLHFNRDNGFLRITITNDTTTINPLPGGGAGLLLLDRLNEFPENIISYSRPKRLETDPFQQEIKIKII